MPCYGPVRVPIRKKSMFPGKRLAYTHEVGCGHCLGCRAEQGRQWAVRIMHERQMHEDAWFLTLTYNDDWIPENGGLYPKDFRRFIKNLRKDHDPGTISYFGCGEYGERTQRPHYHAVLFGAQFLDRYRDPDVTRPGIWRSQTLDSYWGRGFAELGTVSMASASYVAGYVRKKVRQKDYVRADARTGELLEPEFARMSLRPAIGKRWIEKYWSDVYPRDYVVVDGYEAKPPRYYDKWMDEHQPEVMEHVRQKRYDEAIDLDRYTLNAKRASHERRNEYYGRRDTV